LVALISGTKGRRLRSSTGRSGAFRPCLRKPHDLRAVLLPNGDDEVGIELARTVVLIIRDGEPESLVLYVADNVLRAVEKVGELLLKVGMTWNFACVSFLCRLR